MYKKIEKEIQKLEQQKTLKIEKRNELDCEVNHLKNKYQKLEQSTDDFFEKQEGKSK